MYEKVLLSAACKELGVRLPTIHHHIARGRLRLVYTDDWYKAVLREDLEKLKEVRAFLGNKPRGPARKTLEMEAQLEAQKKTAA